tara:strand:+ start:120 stop:863 length:744 start_codon:yes stop_codon:yes gene_type:complete
MSRKKNNTDPAKRKAVINAAKNIGKEVAKSLISPGYVGAKIANKVIDRFSTPEKSTKPKSSGTADLGRTSWSNAKAKALTQDSSRQQRLSKAFHQTFSQPKRSQPSPKPSEPLKNTKSPANFGGTAASVAASGLQSNFGLGDAGMQDDTMNRIRRRFGATKGQSNAFASRQMPGLASSSPCAVKGESKTIVDGKEVDPTKYAERRKKSITKQKKERQATLDSSGKTYTNHKTGKRYRVGTGPNPNLG